jgi:hypothetical protein
MIMNDELESMRKEKATIYLDIDLEFLNEGTAENNENIQWADYGPRFKFSDHRIRGRNVSHYKTAFGVTAREEKSIFY